MGIPRFRMRSPTYHQKHLLGEQWVNAWGYLMKAANVYCCSSSSLGRQELRLEECSDELHKGPPWKEGGPLFLRKAKTQPFCEGSKSYDITSPSIYGGLNYRYVGKFAHLINTGSFGDAYYTFTNDDDLGTKYGATGLKRFHPVKPKADLGQFLAELRDFRSLFKFRLKSFKDLGSSYLNYQFGWKPFLNDIAKFYKAMEKVEKTIRFVRKNNNKWITRGGTVDSEMESGDEQRVGCRIYPQLDYPFYLSRPFTDSYTSIRRVTSNRVWYKARMKYYIPQLKVDSCKSVLTSPLLRRIYGLEVTPALLWELTPWSWLVDWFGNVGDVLANISTQSYDHLVLKYAYVMEHKVIHDHYVSEMYLTTDKGAITIKCKHVVEYESKQRASAPSPFGFHLGWDDLSPYQLSILAALGITRM